jgi:hypothetical protein
MAKTCARSCNLRFGTLRKRMIGSDSTTAASGSLSSWCRAHDRKPLTSIRRTIWRRCCPSSEILRQEAGSQVPPLRAYARTSTLLTAFAYLVLGGLHCAS